MGHKRTLRNDVSRAVSKGESERPHAIERRMKHRRKRLLLLSPLPPPSGGIATWTQAILNSALTRDYDIDVVNSAPSGSKTVSGKSRFRLDRVRDSISTLWIMALRLLRSSPDIVHVNTSYQWGFLRDGCAIWVASMFRCRTVLHFRGGDFPEFLRTRPKVVRSLVIATLQRADRMIALTESTRVFLSQYERHGATEFVPNFVDLRDFEDIPDRQSRTRPVEILFVGWIIEAKGVNELLAAAQSIPGAHWTLVGPQSDEFQDRIRPVLADLGERVDLVPAMPRAEVIDLYRRSDVFVLPSWREGFPNVVLEAMASGLPVVATTVGAIPNAVTDGVEGFLVMPKDVGGLTSAVLRLVESRTLRLEMGARARHRVEREFAMDRVIERLGGIYAEMTSGMES